MFGKASGFAANLDLSTPRRQQRLQAQRRRGVRLQRLLGRLGGRRQRRRLRRPDRRRADADPHGDAFRRELCGVRQGSGFAANLDLSTLDGTNGFKLSGVGGRRLQRPLGRLGGRRQRRRLRRPDRRRLRADPHGDLSGASYVVFGKASGFAGRASTSSASTAATASSSTASAADDYSGCSVRLGGRRQRRRLRRPDRRRARADPNGDRSGASYVVFGKASGFAASLDCPSLDGSNGFKLNGAAAATAAAARSPRRRRQRRRLRRPDRRRAPTPTRTADCSGASYVVFGKASGFAANLDLVEPRRQQRLPAQRRRRRTTAAAARSPRRATSTATASPT